MTHSKWYIKEGKWKKEGEWKEDKEEEKKEGEIFLKSLGQIIESFKEFDSLNVTKT